MTWTIVASYCVFFMTFGPCQSSYNSISSSLIMPAQCEGSAAGYDDEHDIILMFGGHGSNSPQQLIQFQNDQFIYYNQSYLSPTLSISGTGQNYYQLNNTLWMLNKEGTYFITANMRPPYDVTIPDINIPIIVDNNGCIAMTQSHIFVVGGATIKNCEAHAFVQIYDMIHGYWLSGVPSLPAKRMSMACYVVYDTLYAIGGAGDGCTPNYDSIIILNVSDAALANISSQEWQMTPATLNTPSRALSIIKYSDNLIVIGGYTSNGVYVNDVIVINPATGDSWLAGTLSIATSYAACILPRGTNKLYIFGGAIAGGQSDRWQIITLPTVDPTAAPTANPSNPPTQKPTLEPTVAPTAKPTKDPTNPPTQNPSFGPSIKPTSQPSYASLAPTNITINDELYETLSTTVKNVRDTTAATAFIIDTLALVLIVICGSLCFVIIIVLLIAAIYKKKENDLLKHETKIVGANAPNHSNVSAMDDDDVKSAERNVEERTVNVSHSRNAESSSSFSLCQEVNEEKVTKTCDAYDITVAAMIGEKIVSRIIDTKQCLVTAMKEHGEKEESESNDSLYEDQATTGAIISTKQGLVTAVKEHGEKEESESNDSLYEVQATTGAIDPQSTQNAINLMQNMDESDVEEGCNTTK